jgi:hypothetical protein
MAENYIKSFESWQQFNGENISWKFVTVKPKKCAGKFRAGKNTYRVS